MVQPLRSSIQTNRDKQRKNISGEDRLSSGFSVCIPLLIQLNRLSPSLPENPADSDYLTFNQFALDKIPFTRGRRLSCRTYVRLRSALRGEHGGYLALCTSRKRYRSRITILPATKQGAKQLHFYDRRGILMKTRRWRLGPFALTCSDYVFPSW